MTCPSASMLRLLSLALVALPLSSPSPAQAQWQRCASQDEVCRFEGQALVRYGAEGRYAFLVARNRVVCDVEAFGGDPAQGVVKQCDYSYDLNRRETSSSIPSRGWTHCASENEYCRVPGTARMRYGADNRYVYRNVTGDVLCSAKVFGDPAYGEHKTCEYQAAGRGYENVNHGRGWEYCGSEGGYCSFSGPGEVRYGINGKFVVRHAINGIPCALSAFGRDPAYGENKQCFVRLGSR